MTPPCPKGCDPRINCYHCHHCGGYGDECSCGPEVFGCTKGRDCPADWHLHGCWRDQGSCDHSEEHLIRGSDGSAYWPSEVPWNW